MNLRRRLPILAAAVMLVLAVGCTSNTAEVERLRKEVELLKATTPVVAASPAPTALATSAVTSVPTASPPPPAVPTQAPPQPPIPAVATPKAPEPSPTASMLSLAPSTWRKTNPSEIGTAFERCCYRTTLILGTDQKWTEIDAFGKAYQFGVWSVSNGVVTLAQDNRGYSAESMRTTDGWRSMTGTGSNVTGLS